MVGTENNGAWKTKESDLKKLPPLHRKLVEYCLERIHSRKYGIEDAEMLFVRVRKATKIALQMAREGDDLLVRIPEIASDRHGNPRNFRATIPWQIWEKWLKGETQAENKKNDPKTPNNPKSNSLGQLGPRQYHVDGLPYTMRKAVEFAMDDINKLMLARLSDKFFPRLIGLVMNDLTPPRRDVLIRHKDPLYIMCNYLGIDQKGKDVHYFRKIPWEIWGKWWEEEQRQRRV